MWPNKHISERHCAAQQISLPLFPQMINCVLRRGFAALQDVSSLNLAASSGAAFFLASPFQLGERH